MLARIATIKTEIEDVVEVKKWLDRILLKFVSKFAHFNRYEKTNFRLPPGIKHFPQFMYHLRRSQFINPFGMPPDQSLYNRTCIQRESLSNAIVMVQPVLLKYTVDDLDPIAVELDVLELKDDVILLLDTYFNVLVWNGDHIQAWK